MIGRGRVIESDLFGIAERLKEIDEGYFVWYNYVKHRFEVHHRHQRGNTLALVLPFKQLDSRAVNYVQRTRVERKERLLAEIKLHNAKLSYSGSE